MPMNVTAAQWAKVMETHSGVDLKFGPTRVDAYLGDPKRMGFFFARYKFAAKMLRRCHSILDVGCGDGMGTLTFLSDTDASNVVGVDFEQTLIDYANAELLPAATLVRTDIDRLSFTRLDFMDAPPVGMVPGFDGLACLDVIEHIEPALGTVFIRRLADTLLPYGVAMIGTPSLASERYASVHSKAGHINLYDPDRLRAELEMQFKRVFMFSMNDEVVHTGFDKLAHYLLALCIK